MAALEYACVPALAWLELAGLPIDAAAWAARARTEQHRQQALAAQLHTLLNGAIPPDLFGEHGMNWDSPPQVREVLRARGHAIEQTDSGTLLALVETDPLIPILLDYREADKRAGTYGEAWLAGHRHPLTGRIHADYLPLGAATGRMSCTKPNVQNLPRGPIYRSAIRAREGYVLVKADYSQIELRLAAVIAGDEAMLAAYRAGADLHTQTAARVLDLAVETVTAEHRQLAKALNFGLLYGMGARGLRDYAYTTYKVRLTDTDAEQHRDRFFTAYAGLAHWYRRSRLTLAKARGTLETRTLAGRRRLQVTRLTDALNTPVQGSGADGLKLALARLFARRDEAPSARLVAVVHDEILVECPEADAPGTAQWLTRHMTAAMQELVADRVPIVVEGQSGHTWAG